MKYFQNTLLFVFALGFSLVLCEGMFYMLNVNSPEPPEIEVVEGTPNTERQDFFKYHPVYGYSGLPNVSKKFHGKQITHNSKGMRGPEIDYEPAENVERVAFIGDSQTWGWAVSDHETIPFFVSEILNSRAKTFQFEALNFGATGYGVDQSYLRFISEGLRYKPEYVVLTYFADNDIWETGSVEAWGVEKPLFHEKEDGSFCVTNIPPKRASGWPADNLQNKFDFDDLRFDIGGVAIDLSSTQAALYFRNRSLNTSLFGSWGADDSKPLQAIKEHVGCVQREPATELAEWEKKIDLAVKIIDRIRHTVEEQGGKFLFVGKPLENNYRNKELEYNYGTILSRLNDRGVEIIDMYSVFRSKRVAPEVIYGHAGHLTPAGNWLVAESVAHYIAGKSNTIANSRHQPIDGASLSHNDI